MTFAMQRSGHSDLTAQEAADRLAIRELVDAYARCADRRDVVGQCRSSPRTLSSSSTWTVETRSPLRKSAAATARALCLRISARTTRQPILTAKAP
jgi:hypothetical protein